MHRLPLKQELKLNLLYFLVLESFHIRDLLGLKLVTSHRQDYSNEVQHLRLGH